MCGFEEEWRGWNGEREKGGGGREEVERRGGPPQYDFNGSP
jgi:hypothetical protein